LRRGAHCTHVGTPAKPRHAATSGMPGVVVFHTRTLASGAPLTRYMSSGLNVAEKSIRSVPAGPSASGNSKRKWPCEDPVE
jgi:hypothetical protein